MSQEILVNVSPHEVRVAFLESGILQEIHIERSLRQDLLGNIYKGRVSRLLPGIQAAFVDIGLDRAAFLHVSDMGFDRRVDANNDFSHLDITKLLTPGQEILVQVYKDPIGSKGARLTTQFTIPSRFIVLTPGCFQVAVSQKIVDEAERQRLSSMLTAGSHGGYIFRTAALSATQAEIDADKNFLDALWVEIETKSRSVKPAHIVHTEIPIILRVLRDLAGLSVTKIQVDQQEAMLQMRSFAALYLPSLVERIEYYNGDKPLFDLYSVEAELQKALARKVELKSGAHVIFDQTEAMTTIDINTGSFVGQSNLEQTLFETNIEAIDVIARQIRLRNLGGIIIIDFIDMVNAAHREQLLQLLKEALLKDSVKTQISELSSLGLVQMTRKRTRESLEHILCASCPMCQRRGFIKSIETICYEIIRALKRIGQHCPWAGLSVIASPSVVEKLLAESTVLTDLEKMMSKTIKVKPEVAYAQEQYDILPLSEKE